MLRPFFLFLLWLVLLPGVSWASPSFPPHDRAVLVVHPSIVDEAVPDALYGLWVTLPPGASLRSPVTGAWSVLPMDISTVEMLAEDPTEKGRADGENIRFPWPRWTKVNNQLQASYGGSVWVAWKIPKSELAERPWVRWRYVLCEGDRCTMRVGQVPLSEAVRHEAHAARLTLAFQEGLSASRWLEEAIAVMTAESPKLSHPWWVAWLAGMLLNVMPCALPVLIMKFRSYGLGQGGGSRLDQCRHHGGVVLGIVSGFAMLGLLLLGLRHATEGLGWGLLWQQAWFLGGMALVLGVWWLLQMLEEFRGSAFFLGFFGYISGYVSRWVDRCLAWERGWLGSVASGWLVCLLATPCGGPWVGSVVAVAMAAGSLEGFGLILWMGLGFSTPYLALMLLPARWFRRVPRLSPSLACWIRRVMILAFGATAVWLGWMAWTVGSRESSDGVVGVQALPYTEHFDEERLEDWRSQGRVVVVEITASWCLLCQFQRTTVTTPAFRERLGQELGVHWMVGDVTRPNPVLERWMRAQGRTSVPMVVVVGPAAGATELLPELFTAEALEAAIVKVIPSPMVG